MGNKSLIFRLTVENYTSTSGFLQYTERHWALSLQAETNAGICVLCSINVYI